MLESPGVSHGKRGIVFEDLQAMREKLETMFESPDALL